MEASIHLRRVIQEMWAEINRLEKENHALRVKLTSISQTTSSSGRESEGEREEAVCGQSSGSLPGDRPMNSAPAVQEYQGNVMIVRRYAISPSVHSYAANDPWEAKNRLPNNGTSLACSSTRKQDSEEKRLAADACGSHSSSQRAFSDDNFVCSCSPLEKDLLPTLTVNYRPAKLQGKSSCEVVITLEGISNLVPALATLYQ
ncbi:putative coiled-coil domain-containing protein 195 [Rattus rattus]|uniref:putative coiled-coil domain-containing protein 195 n=1 Tax=Rattus rattus TaxID=10117 RepID=UPI0013F2BCF2|nr:putative coiled-coil domain-containing protein 195 [Rattus rattus]